MNEAKPPPANREGLNLDRFRLRGFVERLANADELLVVDKRCELADVAAILASCEKAVLFKNAGGSELVGNVMGSRSRLALAFGVPAQAVVGELERRLTVRPEIDEVKSS